jgi:hypothetical protein
MWLQPRLDANIPGTPWDETEPCVRLVTTSFVPQDMIEESFVQLSQMKISLDRYPLTKNSSAMPSTVHIG